MDPIEQRLSDRIQKSQLEGGTLFEKLFESIYVPADNVMEQGKHLFSCGIGCDACCKRMILATPVEAVAIMQFLDQTGRLGDEKLISSIHEHARLNEGFLETWSDEEDPDLLWFEEDVECPFLDQSACSIYEARPLICRMRHSLSPAPHCSEPWNDIETSSEVDDAVQFFEKGLYEVAKTEGIEDNESHVLTILLSELLLEEQQE